MTITERLRTEFPGITAMIAGFRDALKAHHAYNSALDDMKALEMKREEEKMMNESSLIVSIQNDIGEINVNLMRVNRFAVFLNDNKNEVAMLEQNLLLAKEHIEKALNHLDLLEARRELEVK